MLYASTRNTVTKSLGSAHFTDSIFATSKSDVTGDGYSRHLRNLAAPKPLSEREKALAEMAEAEKQAADDYQGNNARTSHLSGAAIGFTWSPDVENAFKQLATDQSSKLLVVVSVVAPLNKLVHQYSYQTVETPGETLRLVSFEETTPDQVGFKLPPSDPGEHTIDQFASWVDLILLQVYAFFGWPHNLSVSVPREIGVCGRGYYLHSELTSNLQYSSTPARRHRL
jgi:twinfilin-like protein